ncbi:hypothetical protein COB55_04150 [Candidatus Wolfebacteria bacterium]|nr:MAG: hypothetical protein COB55_04150 [Candidatus Wolfebacteria bacterium]
MLQKLSEVLEVKDDLVKRLDNLASSLSSVLTNYKGAVMDSVLVIPDEIAQRYYEMMYTMNVHFTPDGLPGCGAGTGDFISHGGESYLGIELGVCFANMRLMHHFRKYESLFSEWEDNSKCFGHEVNEFVTELKKISENCFGFKSLQNHEQWNDTSAGWNYVGTPSILFVDSLSEVAERLNRMKKKGLSSLARIACDLEAKLRPFCHLAGAMNELRNQCNHKGVPFIKDGMVRMSAPAASGGASLHNMGASDDLLHSMPNRSSFMIVSGQTSMGKITHLGGGRTKGEHFTMRIPQTPFFSMVQEKVASNKKLSDLWQSSSQGDDDKAVEQWTMELLPIENEIIKKVVPDMVSTQVLGLHFDLRSAEGVAKLHPVIAESCLENNTDAVKKHGVAVIRKSIEKVLGMSGDNTYLIPSVFDKAA